jgi:metal-responsive CopG/Arc/MetJ family transcriptional regulator
VVLSLGKVSKKKITYSIDKNLLELFDKYCENNAINKSRYIENLIKQDLRKKKLEDN